MASRTTESHRRIPFRIDLAASGAKEKTMRYTRLSTYDLNKGTFDELTGIVEKGILPTFVQEPGFVNYGLLDAGNHKVVSISTWETREEAQKSAGMAATWVKENIADRVRLLTTQIGDLALFHGVPVTA
jgi:hypothetical protein